MSHDKPFNPFEPEHADGKTIVPPEESLDALMSTPPQTEDSGSRHSVFLPGPSGKFIVASHVDPQWETLLNAAINGWDAARANAVGELFERWQRAEVAAIHNELDKRNLELLQTTIAEDRAKHRTARAEWDKLQLRQERRIRDLEDNLAAMRQDRDQAMEALAPNERELLSTREALQAAEAARDDAQRQAELLEAMKGALEQVVADRRQALQAAVNGNMELTRRVADLKQELHEKLAASRHERDRLEATLEVTKRELHESDEAMRGAVHRANRAEAELDKQGGPQGVRWRNAIAAGLWSQAAAEVVEMVNVAHSQVSLGDLVAGLRGLTDSWRTRAKGLAEYAGDESTAMVVAAMVVDTSPLSDEQVAQLAQDFADNKAVFATIQPKQPLPKHLDVELPEIVMDERGSPKAVIAQPPPVQVVEGGGAQPAAAVTVRPNPIIVDDEAHSAPLPGHGWVFRESGADAKGIEPWPHEKRPAFGRKVEACLVRMTRSEGGGASSMGKTVEVVHDFHEERLVEEYEDGTGGIGGHIYEWDNVFRWRYLDVAPEDDDAVSAGDAGGEE